MADKKFNYFYSFENYQADFLRIMHHAFFGCHDTQYVDILEDREQGHEILIFQTVNLFCETAMYVSPGLHLQALTSPSLHYMALQSQLSTEPTLLQSQFTIHVLLVIAWSMNWWNIQQKCGE